jgi:hypothetical protein
MWLTDREDAADLKRPDGVHYVIDTVPDVVRVDGVDVGAVQVWVDPAYPDAHEDEALRDFLDHWGREASMVAIIRYSHDSGFVLFPPSLTRGRGWIKEGGEVREREAFYA